MANKFGGGAKTNFVGLQFENNNSIKKDLELAIKMATIKGVDLDPEDFVYKDGKRIGYFTQKKQLYKKFLIGIDPYKVLSATFEPDEAFINEEQKIVYIIEKKFQHQYGTADEKLQTCHFKLRQYTKIISLKNFKVRYIYFLSDWFKKDKYKDVLNYINEIGCEYYFNKIPFSTIGIF